MHSVIDGLNFISYKNKTKNTKEKQQTPKFIKIWTVRKETTRHNWMTSITNKIYKSVLCAQAMLCMQWIHFLFSLCFYVSFVFFSLFSSEMLTKKMHLSLQSLPIKLLWQFFCLILTSKITVFSVAANSSVYVLSKYAQEWTRSAIFFFKLNVPNWNYFVKCYFSVGLSWMPI